MSAWTPKERDAFAVELATAGWDVETWDAVREAGARVDLDGEAEHIGPSLGLRLELPAASRHVAMQIHRRDGELVLWLRLHPKDGVQSVLAPIVAVQDSLDESSVADLVKALMRACDRVLMQTDQGLIALSE